MRAFGGMLAAAGRSLASTGSAIPFVASACLGPTSSAILRTRASPALLSAAGPASSALPFASGMTLLLSRTVKSAGHPKLKRVVPRTPGTRHLVKIDRSELWRGQPVKALTVGLRKSGGRNNQGVITVRHRGGGHKRRYRLVDFKRSILDEPGTVQRLEYDPNRSGYIALVSYPDGRVQYILAPHELSPGDTIMASRTKELDVRIGNAMALEHMPIGTMIHNVEVRPGLGGALMRSAGAWGRLLEKNVKPNYALIRTSSKEQRLVHIKCMATVGQVSNLVWASRVLAKAGRTRWLGRRPVVRGVAMNPVDHPHGGGSGVGRPKRTKWGKPAHGVPTRNKQHLNNKFIVTTRKQAAKLETAE